MKRTAILITLICMLTIPVFAEEADFTQKDPQALSSISLKGMTRKELRKAFRSLLDTYTELYNIYYEIEPETEAPAQADGEAAAAEVYTASVSLNIRKEPSTDSQILGRFEPGAIVDVESIENGWAKIRYQDETAYVSAQYVAKTSVPADQAPAPQETGCAVPGSNADFEGCNYQDVIDMLEHAGFTNIQETPEETALSDDLPFGLLTETGDVKEVSVDGKNDYVQGDRFPEDAEVTVVYFQIQ